MSRWLKFINNSLVESNARLFVGRRRLDLMMEYLADLEKDQERVTAETNAVWRNLADSPKVLVQVAANVENLKNCQGDLVEPWKTYFKGVQKPLSFRLKKTIKFIVYFVL